MLAHDTVSQAIWGLASRPARTAALVTVLAAGVTATVFVAAITAGFAREIDRLSFGPYGTAVVISENTAVNDRHGSPKRADRLALATDIAGITSSAAWSEHRGVTYAAGQSVEFAVFGADGDFSQELDAPINRGRTLSEQELGSIQRVCLVGIELAEELGAAAEPGSVMQINGIGCQIVGVLGEPHSRPAAKYSKAVIAPFGAVERYFTTAEEVTRGSADHLTLFLEPGTDVEEAQMLADLELRKRYGVPLSRPSPFAYGDPAADIEDVALQRRMLSRLLSTLAGLSLFTSVIAFGAMAAASTIARTREFALRMAMGALSADVRSQVLLEFGVLGVLGGLFGLASGTGLAGLAAALWAWPFVPTIGVAFIALICGTSVGLGVGLWLSRRVSRLPLALAAKS